MEAVARERRGSPVVSLASSVGVAALRFFSPPLASLRRRGGRKAKAIMDIGQCRCRPVQDRPSKWSRPSSSLSCRCACSQTQRAIDGPGKLLQRGVRRQVGQVDFRSPVERCTPTSQTSSPGRCWTPMSWIRWGDPSATRTRRSAKRAHSRPFVPRRQLTVRHFAVSSMVCAPIDVTSGICRWRGPPNPATRKIIATSAG